MKNRAKCKLCKSEIESFHASDYVMCKCGEIFVDGGSAFKCGAKDWDNFLRVDENGNEIIITVQKGDIPLGKAKKLHKKELLSMLEEIIASYERLPKQAMTTPVTHYDLLSSLLVLLSIFKADLKDDN